MGRFTSSNQHRRRISSFSLKSRTSLCFEEMKTGIETGNLQMLQEDDRHIYDTISCFLHFGAVRVISSERQQQHY